MEKKGMVRGHRTPKSSVTLPDSEFRAIENWVADDELVAILERLCGIKLSEHSKRRIGFTLCCYASSAFDDPDRDRKRLKSESAVANALDSLFLAFEEQRQYPIPDARREGYEYFVMYSQRGFTEEESRQRAEAVFGGRDPGPPGLCRDAFERFVGEQSGSYASLGDRQGWLEVLLREIRGKLGWKSLQAGKRGPKGKAKYRTFVIYELAEVFEQSGGTVKAYKNSISGNIEGDFIQFVAVILQTCPPTLRKYLGTGINDAIVRWVQSGRKTPSDGLISLRLC